MIVVFGGVATEIERVQHDGSMMNTVVDDWLRVQMMLQIVNVMVIVMHVAG